MLGRDRYEKGSIELDARVMTDEAIVDVVDVAGGICVCGWKYSGRRKCAVTPDVDIPRQMEETAIDGNWVGYGEGRNDKENYSKIKEQETR